MKADQTDPQNPIPLTFHLRFKNRRTFWRYVFNKEQNNPDGQLGAFERDGDANEKQKFKTIDCRPLTLAPQQLKKFTSNVLLPNPDVNLVKPNKQDRKVYSEIFIAT